MVKICEEIQVTKMSQIICKYIFKYILTILFRNLCIFCHGYMRTWLFFFFFFFDVSCITSGVKCVCSLHYRTLFPWQRCGTGTSESLWSAHQQPHSRALWSATSAKTTLPITTETASLIAPLIALKITWRLCFSKITAKDRFSLISA